jgi:hypothetical protein
MRSRKSSMGRRHPGIVSTSDGDAQRPDTTCTEIGKEIAAEEPHAERRAAIDDAACDDVPDSV